MLDVSEPGVPQCVTPGLHASAPPGRKKNGGCPDYYLIDILHKV